MCMYCWNSSVLLLFSDYVVNRMVLFKHNIFLYEHPVVDYSHMINCVLRTVVFLFLDDLITFINFCRKTVCKIVCGVLLFVE